MVTHLSMLAKARHWLTAATGVSPVYLILGTSSYMQLYSGSEISFLSTVPHWS